MENKRKTNDKKVISFIPDGEFYYKKAMQAMQRERFDEAQKFLKRAIDLSPEDPLFLMQYGVLVMEEGRFQEAHEILLTAHERDVDSSEIIFYLAEVHAHLNLLQEAKAYAQKYIKIDFSGPFKDEAKEIIDYVEQNETFLDETENSEVYLLQEKARRLMEAGEFKEAVELFESIITDYPDFWAAYNNLALAYFYVGKKELASELLYDVLQRNKGNLHALCNLAIFYYYDKKEEDLEALLELLVKIKPYLVEHRYKLGATFALIGRHKEAYTWLRNLQKTGFNGDAGFYFWLSHSAYFTGHEEIARDSYAKLVEIDPSKEGYEPWKDLDGSIEPNSIEQDRQYLLNKIQHDSRSERMLGFYLLGKSAHKQEIISHPSYIDIESLSAMEKLFLAHGLDYLFVDVTPFEKSFLRALEATELLYQSYCPLNAEMMALFQTWFAFCEKAFTASYAFKNSKALAAAIDYISQSANHIHVTKKEIAEKYGVTAPTLTKYLNECSAFLPDVKS